MTNKQTINKEGNVRSMVKALKVGESASFPIKRRSYIYNLAYNHTVEWGMKVTVHSDREKGTVSVTRVN